MRPDPLSLRAINRATLARQLLLERVDRPIPDTIEHLVGMQAQEPMNPYLGLFSRLDKFDPHELGQLLIDRKVVRIVVMRGTIHLVTADDALLLRPLVKPVLDRELVNHSQHKHAIAATDFGPVLDVVRPLLEAQPLNGKQLRAAIAERFPDLDAPAVAYACRNLLALVQVPPRGVWGHSAQVTLTTVESWLGRPLAANPSIDDVVLRYFAASGPASVADVASWCGLTGMREVVERIRPKLRPFTAESGRELFDLPDAPRPDPDTPAPVRFFPEYDNLFLSYADRSRFDPVGGAKTLFAGPTTVRGTVLHDGFLCGTWRIEGDRQASTKTLVVDQSRKLTKKAMASITAEARRLLRLLEPDSDHDVRFVAPS